MALKIRLQRGGSAHSPVYRLVVAESAARRDGKFVEKLGTYSPQARGSDPLFIVNVDRVEYWLKIGAKPTDTAKSLIKKARAAADSKNDKGEVIQHQPAAAA